ncbi:O-methylsterigmatocystin oxidoreductase [Coprinopsis cinerea AmutBmut pab1-1]|nr:O-methylsterigmatocystin oxidoreductase [Coprinopsis cinerea AmutBmut pab1-1]
MYPDVQRKAQAEIDRVVGSHRLPTFNDHPRLVYLQAVLKEVFRWHTTVPLGLTHVSTEDYVYNGYFIPKGSNIMTNVWAIMHDPNVFEDPFEFKPERYLKNGEIDHTVLAPETAAFGFGRRICPGRHLGKDSLTYVAACLLAVFDIRPPKDENGNPIKLELKVTSELASTPLPFELDIVPRSPQHLSLLRTE